MDIHSSDHSDEGLDLRLVAFKEEEIRKIYINKVIYSLLKYNQQSETVKNFYKNKYEYAKGLHRGNFEDGILSEVEEILKEEKEKYNAVRMINKEVVDFVAPIVVHNFTTGCKKNYNEEQRLKYLLEFITKTFKYNYDAKKYNYNIPFGMDYDLEFSNSVPVYDFKSLLITKEVLGNELASIIKILGEQIGLDIKIVIAENEAENELHYLNAVLLHNKTDDSETLDKLHYRVSYIDATSILTNEKVEEIKKEEEDKEVKLTEKEIEEQAKERCLLLSKYMLNSDNKYTNFYFPNFEIEKGNQEGESLAYNSIIIDDITPVIENDARLVAVQYVESDIFEKKENHSI